MPTTATSLLWQDSFTIWIFYSIISEGIMQECWEFFCQEKDNQRSKIEGLGICKTLEIWGNPNHIPWLLGLSMGKNTCCYMFIDGTMSLNLLKVKLGKFSM